MNALPQVTWLEGIAHLRMASGHLVLHCFVPRIKTVSNSREASYKDH